MSDGFVVLRADMSRQIGTGHVRRCIALAGALVAQGVKALFVTRALGLNAESLIAQAGHDLVILAPPDRSEVDYAGGPPHAAWAEVSAEHDAEETIAVLKARGRPDALVVDHYAFDARWHRRVAPHAAALIVIDDLADRMLDADLVIDHNPHPDHAAKYASRSARSVPVLGGPLYALLGAAYRDPPRNPAASPVRSIGVFMGGADQIDATGQVLTAIDSTGFDGGIEIVVASTNPKLSSFNARAALDKRLRVTTDLPDLAAFFARHELHVGAGGGATWERFRGGAPTIAVACAANQRDVLRHLVAGGYQFGVDCLDVDAIGEAIGSALADHAGRRRVSRAAAALVDGRGAERVAQTILALRHERAA